MAVTPLFVHSSFDGVDFNFVISDSLLEILDKNTPIKKDEDYVNDYYNFNDATEDNIENYSSCPIFSELKDDMGNYCTEICNKVKRLPGVEDAFVDRSNRVGISTYITVKIKHPKDYDKDIDYTDLDDKRFIDLYDNGIGGRGNGLSGEYKLRFRLSTHRPGSHGTDANYDIDVTNKIYNYFKDKVINHVKNRVYYVRTAWKNYKETGELPANQQLRNRSRVSARQQRRAQYTEAITLHNLKLLGKHKLNKKHF